MQRFPLQGFGFYPKTEEGQDAKIAGVWEFGGYTIALENDGNEVIENQDVDFVFEEGSVIWMAYVTGIPESAAKRIQELAVEKRNVRSYKISYLNPQKKFKETISFNFTVYNTKASPKVIAQGPNLLCHEYSEGLGYKIGFYVGSTIDLMISLLMLFYFSNLLIFKWELPKDTEQVILIILLLYVIVSLGSRLFSWYVRKRTMTSKV